MNDLMQRCRGRWFDLLQMLGGLDRRYLNGKHGPCPMCGGKDRFRWDNKDNRGTYYCNQCGAGDGAALLMRLKNWDFSMLVAELEQNIGKAHRHVATAKTSSQAQRQSMERIWHFAQAIEFGDPAHLYLRRRGVDLPRYPGTLRYHPNLLHKQAKAKFPALLARVDGPDGRMAQLHQTFLKQDGSKADLDPVRLFHWGPTQDGAAVQLGRPNGVIGIAEGLETSLSSMLRYGHAVWAALNAQMLLKWNPPGTIERVRIFGDNDVNFTGQSTAFGLANRLAVQRKGLEVEVLIPDGPGTDWNDEISAEGPRGLGMRTAQTEGMD